MIYGQEKRKSPRNTTLFLDWIHIVIGILIVVMAVIAFVSPENNMFLFPLIFFLAAVLNTINGIYKYKLSGRDKKKKAAAFAQIFIAVFLMVITIISAVSIWR